MSTQTKIKSEGDDMKLVAYENKTGEVLKEGSVYIWIRERHVPRPEMVRIDTRLTPVRYLLGAESDFSSRSKHQRRKAV